MISEGLLKLGEFCVTDLYRRKISGKSFKELFKFSQFIEIENKYEYESLDDKENINYVIINDNDFIKFFENDEFCILKDEN